MKNFVCSRVGVLLTGFIALVSGSSFGQSLAVTREIALNPLLGFPSHTENAVKIFRPFADAANGKVYVAPILGGYVAKVDTAHARLDDLIPTGLESRQIKTIIADDDGLFLLHWDDADRSIYAFDLATGQIGSQLQSVAGLSLTQSDDYLYYGEGTAAGSRLHVIAKRRVLAPDSFGLARVRSEVINMTPLLTGIDNSSGRMRLVGLSPSGSACRIRVQTRALDGGKSLGVPDVMLTSPVAFDSKASHGHYAYDANTDESFLFATATAACASTPSPRVLVIRHAPPASLATTSIDFSSAGTPGCPGALAYSGATEMHVLDNHIALLAVWPASGSPNQAIVGFFDRATGCLTNSHTLDGKSFSGTADPVLNRLILSNMDGTRLTVIEPGGIARDVDVGNTAEGALKHHTDDVYYIFNRLGGSELVIYNAPVDQATSISLPLWPKWGYVSSGLNALYIVSHLGTTLTKLDLATPSAPVVARQVPLSAGVNTTDQIGSLAIDSTAPLRLFISHPERLELARVRLPLRALAAGVATYPIPGLPPCTVGGPFEVQLAYVGNPYDWLAVYCKRSTNLRLLDPASMSVSGLMGSVPDIAQGHYENDIMYADPANNRVWVGPYFFELAAAVGTLRTPDFFRTGPSGAEPAEAQRVLWYDQTHNRYITAALGTDEDYFSVFQPIDPRKRRLRELTRLAVRTDRLMDLGVSFDEGSSEILVTVHNANKLIVIKYIP